MPCNSDHMEPTVKEKQIQQAAKLYIYVAKKLDSLDVINIDYGIPTFIINDAKDIYARDELCMSELCALLTELKKENPKYFDKIVYNAKDKTARRLADWWEEHQKEDEKRKHIERKNTSYYKLECFDGNGMDEGTTDNRFKELEGLEISYDGGRFNVSYKGKIVYETMLAGNDFSFFIEKTKGKNHE